MQQNDLLNQVLIVMGRSLLQYAPQAWPWIGSGSNGKQSAIDGLIADQRNRIQDLAEFLDARRWTIDFGAFPDFTNLHFLALDFVLPHLAENEQSVVNEIETAVARCGNDAAAAALLTGILAGERAVLAKLKDLSRPTPQPTHSAA